MKTVTKKMHFLYELCCICMNKSDLKHLFDVDNDGVSHYNKLTSSIAEMNFKEMNDQRLICGECCVTLNTVYNFRQTCLRSKTNLITYLSQLQTYSHVSGTTNDPLKDLQPDLIVVKEERERENEDSNGFEEYALQRESKTKNYEKNIPFLASVKEECESEGDSSAHEDATADHMKEDGYTDVKIEDVEQQTMEDENFINFNEIDIKEDPLAIVKEEPMSDTETPQDGSTCQADAGASQEPKEIQNITIKTEFTQNPQKDVGVLYKCEICEKSFNHKGNFNYHMRTHSGVTPYECEICKKGFIRKDTLATHRKMHSGERPHECEICKKSFAHKRYLDTHMLIHSGETPYECEICKKSFNLRGTLAVHKKQHSDERPFKCEVCQKGFIRRDNLDTHMKVHTGERPYKCEICQNGFTHKKYLEVHLRKHSGERPYECEICKKTFIQKGVLNIHMKIHSVEKPYECEICKKGFTQKGTLSRHMKTHAKIQNVNT